MTELYDSYSSEFRQKKLQEEIDSFHFSNVHKFILKFCRNNEFSLKVYKEYISKKLSGKNLDREITWKRSSLEKLARMGYFEKVNDDAYQLTGRGVNKLQEIKNEEKSEKNKHAGIKNEDAPREFKPGANHKYLLKFSKDGMLDFMDVEKRISELPKSRQARELNMKRGMLKKLIEAGFLETVDTETNSLKTENRASNPLIYKLTAKAFDFLYGSNLEKPAKKQLVSENAENETLLKDNTSPHSAGEVAADTSANSFIKAKEIKITKYDIDNIVSPAVNGILTRETVFSSPKRSSVEKRIATLLATGLLKEKDNGWLLTDELLDRADVRNRINLQHERSRSRYHSLECLTAEQKKIICDLKDFLNLSGSQILKHIYNGNEKLYRSDMQYLLNKGIIKKDRRLDIYVFTKQGRKLAADLTGDHNIFNSKIYSRREELRHDVLIYSAFKDAEKELKDKGKVITSYKTDRHLRSEDVKNIGVTAGDYPDLHIEYKDEKTGEKGSMNIEVDVGYSEKVIAQKLKIPNLRWYTNSQRQKEKVLKKARYMKVKIIDEDYWR